MKMYCEASITTVIFILKILAVNDNVREYYIFLMVM